MKIRSAWCSSFIVGLIFLFATLGLFGLYVARVLDGDINNHILSSTMFGVPDQLQDHGLHPFYENPASSGWDGQFYYYMSNDLLGRTEAVKHIDAPSYRYQRIGLSLYAAFIAKLAAQDWVSPKLFFFAYLGLITLATFVGARLFSQLGGHPALILLWSFSVGTQLTLFNALPDAAADAFLIMALAALVAGWIGVSAFVFVMAALCREVYVVFPSMMLLFLLSRGLLGVEDRRQIPSLVLTRLWERGTFLLLLPGVVALAWRIYITQHFGISPSAQAFGILGLPLMAWLASFKTAVGGNGVNSEVICLILFIFILAAAVFVGWRSLWTTAAKSGESLRSLGLSTLIFVALYLSFGPTVTGHYTGYFKAASVFFFLIPFLLVALEVKGAGRFLCYLVLSVALVGTSVVNLHQRVLSWGHAAEDNATKMYAVSDTRSFACLRSFQATVHVNRVSITVAPAWVSLFGGRNWVVINVAVTNHGTEPWISTRGTGSVFMSYHWLDSSGKVVVDGIRSALPSQVLPGQTVDVDVITMLPAVSGLALRLSPVQEGCAWFYQANPEIGRGFAVYAAR